jgi:SAM-dependent methyltransferase
MGRGGKEADQIIQQDITTGVIMHWRTKAKIMKACALLPSGVEIYSFIQKRFGRLKANPMSRIPAQIKMARWILEMGGKIEGKTFFEVGTGHNPIVPIGFFLCGAEKVVTVDLHKRLEFGILKKSLVWMIENRDEIYEYYDGVAEKAVFDERMDLIDNLKKKPEKFLSEADIRYLAPADAADIALPDASVDYHVSTTVFEHIPGADIERILIEAKRILKKDGVAIHFIDLSDHFQHQDKRITSINFLRYSEKEWNNIAGNEFAYCNRLRASDYLDLFRNKGFETCQCETEVDDEARQILVNGFAVDSVFDDYRLDDLSTIQFKVLLKVKKEMD